ncbi:hypothetical protein O3P69_007952 [Scylla paramamosain]|uniref:Uncharacterized protein n=1 Tax=Scylla paramamosain TaxID=85552 RepID=A0AAW0SZC2_SCYPA
MTSDEWWTDGGVHYRGLGRESRASVSPSSLHLFPPSSSPPPHPPAQTTPWKSHPGAAALLATLVRRRREGGSHPCCHYAGQATPRPTSALPRPPSIAAPRTASTLHVVIAGFM